MRHLSRNKKFHRKKGQRTALFKHLANNLILEGKITTTEAKAKALKSFAEKLITLAKKQTLASHRLLISRISKIAANKLFYEIAPKYKSRRGGYLRVTKAVSLRQRDASRMATVEFV